MKLIATKAQSQALNALRGLPEDAHMLLMTSRQTEQGEVLDGSEEAFEELVEFISDELAEGMLSARSAGALSKLCVRINPSCADWLGS